jgi:hypothetical protein
MSAPVLTRRGRRVVHAAAAAAVALLVLAAASLVTGGGTGDDRWLSLPPALALAAAPCPDAADFDIPPVRQHRLRDARQGSFHVFGPQPTRLRVPIDWSTDPLGAHRYRQNLQKLRFLAPLLSSYAAGGDREDLHQALEIALDWIRRNPRGAAGTPAEAWSDKVVGDRVPYLGYVLRAAGCEHLLSRGERRIMLRSIREHGRVLASKQDFVPDNHGLFVDLGLLRLADYFPFLDQAERWRGLSRDRFEATLRGRLSEGVWLEHSSAYQFLVIGALERYLAAYGPDPELVDLLAQMKSAAAWFVKPNGELTQFGDSNLDPAPDWARSEADRLSGLKAFFGAGFAFVRAPEDSGSGYLAVTDGFHNLTHKHADELSFELFDHGTTVIQDTGLYDKDPGPVRDFVTSARAHSVLTADGQEFPITDAGAAYGSGLIAAGEGDGWYGIEGRNPLLTRQGVDHHRLFLYRPGVALIVVDRVRSRASHTYTRYLQFGPSAELRAGGPRGSLELKVGSMRGGVYDLAPSGTVRSKVRGSRDPLQGWTSPDFREFRPRWTVAYSNQGTTQTSAITLALDATALHASSVHVAGERTTVGLVDRAGNRSTVEVVRTGRTLAIGPAGR